jgi:pyruvate/2-oxoacid:ferredoxin oxidoreductase alpha subunit
MTTINDKWKLFALCHVLSDYTGDGVALFDKLTECEYGESNAVFEEYSVIEWQPFEYWGADDVSDLIISMATSAQQTETEVTA